MDRDATEEAGIVILHAYPMGPLTAEEAVEQATAEGLMLQRSNNVSGTRGSPHV